MIDQDSMNKRHTVYISINTKHRRFVVHKRNIIDSLPNLATSMAIITKESILSSNENCCRTQETEIIQPSSTQDNKNLKINENMLSESKEFIVDVPKQTQPLENMSNQKLPLFDDVMNNAWSLSNIRIENLTITNKRCQFSNEAVSIKPITAGIFVLTVYMD